MLQGWIWRSWKLISNMNNQACDEAYDGILAGGGRKPSVDPVPKFRPEWEAEFQRVYYQPRTIRAVCCIAAVFFNYNFLNAVGGGNDGEDGGSTWLCLTWISNVICGGFYLLFAVLFSLSKWRTFCMVHYDEICSFTIILTYITLVSTYLMTEIRRAIFQNSNFKTIHWGIDYSVFLPTRTCNDSDPIATWTNLSEESITSLGCNDLILSGGSYSSYVLLNLLPLIYRMGSKLATRVAVVNSVVLICSVLAVGTKSWDLVSSVVCQLAAGLLASYFCGQRKILARQQFSVAKGTKQAARQNSNLLYTLIPQNVVAKLATHKGSEMLGTSIKQCTIMFCALEPQEEMQTEFSEEVFDLFHEAFSAFDRAVQRYGMFKYQHVGDWYIVACPRAACPFDEDEQARPYPEEYSVAMVLLANELKEIASGFRFQNDRQLWLKAGINCGPVAGAVIGSHRSFYCLYGDTINTSARMCKYAKEDKIHCSSDFENLVRSAKAKNIVLESRGVNLIKGKGMMETFDITVREIESDNKTWQHRFPRSSSVLCDLGAESLPSPRPVRPRCSFDAIFWILDLIRQLYLSWCKTRSDQIKYDELSDESKMWIANPEHGIETRWMVFRDPNFEDQFRQAHSRNHRQGLLSGLLLHWGAVICQWHLLTHPEYEYDFEAFGSPELASKFQTVRTILDNHWIATSILSCALAFVVLWNPVHTRVCSKLFVPLKLLHLAVSIMCFHNIPAEIGWTIIFCVEILLLHGWMGTLSYTGTLTLTACSFLAFSTSLIMERGIMMFPLLKAFAYALGSVWLSRIFSYNQRIRWRLHKVFKVELNRLRHKIFDLLPPNIANEMLHFSSKHTMRGASLVEKDWKLACEYCKAVVLQLDICKFTVMSQTMSPIQVAQMVHTLFCDFDRAVTERNLFKMDTIGDAYVVAGFVTCNSEMACNDEEVNTVCSDILYVAKTMISSLERHRKATGQDTHCRIGISTGNAIAGVLGRLQPRFHIFGEALRTAEKHEQTGKIDAVHASQAFMKALKLSCERRKSQSQGHSLTSSRTGGTNRSDLMESGQSQYEIGDLVRVQPSPGYASHRSSSLTVVDVQSDLPLSPGQFDWKTLDAEYDVADNWLPSGWRMEALDPVTDMSCPAPKAEVTPSGVAMSAVPVCNCNGEGPDANDPKSYILYPAPEEASLHCESEMRRQSVCSAQSEVGRAV